MLKIYNITYAWPTLTKSGLRDVSLHLSEGEILAVCGPNGSGKSTLLKIVAGLVPFPLSGRVEYLGQDFLKKTNLQQARQIAYIGSDLRSEFPITVQEAVTMGPSRPQYGIFPRQLENFKQGVKDALKMTHCYDLRDRLLRTLSGGERQLVALARGLALGAKVLLLDETLSQMDLHHQVAVGRLLRNLITQGYSFMIVSHDLNLACEWADTALFLKDGRRIFHGPVSDVIQSKNLDLIYPQADLHIAPSPTTGKPKIFFRS